MTRPVFRIDPEILDALRPGADFLLSGPEAHHARTVKRLAPGEELDLVDGTGRRAGAVVVGDDVLPAGEARALGPGHEPVLPLRILEPVRADATSRVILVQALAKGDRDLLAVEMATELGAEAIIPWQADRSIVRWKGDRAQKAHAKWERTVQAAAKQARRAEVPEVLPVHGTRALAAALGPEDTVLLLQETARTPLVKELRDLPARGRILVLVGPEGGIGPDEAALLREAGAREVLLGPDVLRSSTAGAAAIALTHAASGYWGQDGIR